MVGQAYEESFEVEEAQAIWLRVLALDANHVEAQMGLARLLDLGCGLAFTCQVSSQGRGRE